MDGESGKEQTYVLHETRSADHNLSVASSLMNGEQGMKLRSRIRRYDKRVMVADVPLQWAGWGVFELCGWTREERDCA